MTWSIAEGQTYLIPTAPDDESGQGGDQLTFFISHDNAHLSGLRIAHTDGTTTEMIFNRNGELLKRSRKDLAAAATAKEEE